MRAVYLTAGAAGMYCGSCMHDNALARAMIDRGVDCLLQPIYTPIRTDDKSVADDQVFFGGIHVYLLQKLPWLKYFPRPIRRVLDWSPLMRFATQRSHATNPTELGELAVSMLRGTEGRQSDEVERLVDWLAELNPDAIVLSNLLIGGALPAIRTRLPKARIVVLLQGDDIFLNHLSQPHRDAAVELCRGLVRYVDRFVVHSRFYAEKMGGMLAIPGEKIIVTPLSIDTKRFRDVTLRGQERDQFRVGYLARIAPEKGLHHLVDSFVRLANDDIHHDMTLHVAGWLGDANQGYLDEQRSKIDSAALSSRFHYHGSLTLEEKVTFLRGLDLLCVPTDYEDPKGLFVLESLAAGVPVIQPDHGAFPELIAATGGGVLVPPGDVAELSMAISRLKQDPSRRLAYAQDGCAKVHANHAIEQAAAEMQKILFED